MTRQKSKINRFRIILVALLFFSVLASSARGQESVIVGTVSIALETPLTLDLSSRSSVFINKNFNLKAKLKNIGQNDVDGITLTLDLPVSLNLIRGDLIQNMGSLRAGERKIINWRIKASALGDYIIQVQASGIEQNSNEEVEVLASLTINIKKQRFYHLIFQSWLEFFNFILNRSLEVIS